MKKTSGNDLMRINGNQGAANGARKPLVGANETFYGDYGESEYEDYSNYGTEAQANPVTEVEGYFDGDYSVDRPDLAGSGYYDDYGFSNTASKKKTKTGAKATANTKMGKAQVLMIVGMVVLATVAVVCGIALFKSFDEDSASVKTDVIVEAGTPITLEAFFDRVPSDAVFLTDISGIDTREPAAYQLKIGYGKNKEADVIVRIEDHTGPTGDVVPMKFYLNWKMPEAKECVINLYDLSGVAKIEYQEGTPKFNAGGEFQVPVIATDVYGNSTVFQVPFTIIDDHTPPVIKGVHDFVLDGNPDQLNFLAGVTATDDYDPAPVIKVDDSAVDYTKAGIYEIVYKAIDQAGNVGTAKAKLEIKMPTEEIKNTSSSNGDNGTYYVGDGDPYALAENILSGLRRGSDVETARAIFNWVHDTLWFKLLSGTPNYEAAAYRGFTLHSGDCYVYYSCCKMLLDAAGIPNMRVDRYPAYNGNIHFWLLVKLNGEWYHCDATEGYSDHPGIWFMCTDEEIDDRYHQFDGSLYPERAGGSKEYKATATPTPSASPSPSVTVTPTGNPSGTVSPTPGGPTDEVSPTPTAPDVSPTPTENPEVTDPPTPTPDEGPSPTPVEDTPTPQEDTPTPPPEDTPALPEDTQPEA